MLCNYVGTCFVVGAIEEKKNDTTEEDTRI
jgi:hypothetical protein